MYRYRIVPSPKRIDFYAIQKYIYNEWVTLRDYCYSIDEAKMVIQTRITADKEEELIKKRHKDKSLYIYYPEEDSNE